MLKRIALATAAIVLAATAVTAADDHHDDKRVVNKTVVHRTVVRRPTVVRGWSNRSDFRQGGRVARGDWDRGRVVDYRTRRLRPPPRGYEWREVGGRYVLAAVATGLIASIIMGSQ